jgi:hypothetical protein
VSCAVADTTMSEHLGNTKERGRVTKTNGRALPSVAHDLSSVHCSVQSYLFV